jgi:hypothetical protein
MAGSARSIQGSWFSGLRVASTSFTPEHSKNGVNVSAKLTVNAFMNIASRANNGEGRNEVVSFTVWGKLAHTCAKSMSPGKEFNCTAGLRVYQGRVFHNQQPVTLADGNVLMTKRSSFTVEKLTFGAESKKHINNEIQANVRPADWDRDGTPGQAQWMEILKQRQAIQFNAQAPTYGYAKILAPTGANITAYIEKAATGVAATFAGINPAGTIPVVIPDAAPAIIPAVSAGGFIVPGV